MSIQDIYLKTNFTETSDTSSSTTFPSQSSPVQSSRVLGHKTTTISCIPNTALLIR